MANQQNTATVDVMDKIVDIDPIGAVYNVTNTQIEEFVDSYLTNTKGIQGVQVVRLIVHHEGDIYRGVQPDISFILFLDLNSPDVVSDLNKIPHHLRKLMGPSSLQASQKLTEALAPITREFNMGASTRDDVAYVQLDLFKVLGLMFAARRNIHQIRVMDVKQTGKNRSIFMIAKVQMMVEKTNIIVDKYDRLSQAIREERQ